MMAARWTRRLTLLICGTVLTVIAPACLTPDQPLAGYVAAAISPDVPADEDVPEWVSIRLREQLARRLGEELGLQIDEAASEPAPGGLWLRVLSVSYRVPIETAFAIDRGFGRRAGLTARLMVWDDEQRDLLLESEVTGPGSGEWPPAESLQEARLLRMIDEVVDQWIAELRQAGAGSVDGEG